MKQIQISHLLIGMVGLASAVWVNFLVTLPLFAYLVVIPLIFMPSLFLILLGLAPLWRPNRNPQR